MPRSLRTDQTSQGHLAMLLFSALVAGAFSLGGQVANDIAPAALNAFRFVIASTVLATIVFARGGIPREALHAPWRYLILGALFSFYFVMMFEGLKTAPPVSAAAVFTLTPVMSAIFGYALLKQVATPRMALGLAIGASGALWVIFRGDIGSLLGFEIGQGEFIYFWGCIAHALYTPAVRYFNRGEPVLVFSLLTLLACAVILLIWGAGDILATDVTTLRPLVWVTLAYIAVFASATTVFLIQFASMRLPSSKVMAYTYLTPTWVILWEIGMGQGVPPVIVLGGIGLTILALLLLLKNEA